MWGFSLEGKTLQKHYFVEEKVGQGGMSWLFRVRHTVLQETLALKLLYPHLSEDPTSRMRFIDEGRIQFNLRHPNIVRVTDLVVEGTTVGIVQEWVEGLNLKEYIVGQERLLSFAEIWFLIDPILQALQYAHDMDIVHRDIKPSNVMLHVFSDRIVPKLTDFGVAKILNDLGERTTTGTTLGTFYYIAPEQIRDSKSVDRRADIYSLGTMLFQLLTGNLPFPGTIEEVIYKQAHVPPPHPQELNPAIPDELSNILLRCLRKSPNERFSTCRELHQELLRVMPAPVPPQHIPHKVTTNHMRLSSSVLTAVQSDPIPSPSSLPSFPSLETPNNTVKVAPPEYDSGLYESMLGYCHMPEDLEATTMAPEPPFVQHSSMALVPLPGQLSSSVEMLPPPNRTLEELRNGTPLQINLSNTINKLTQLFQQNQQYLLTESNEGFPPPADDDFVQELQQAFQEQRSETPTGSLLTSHPTQPGPSSLEIPSSDLLSPVPGPTPSPSRMNPPTPSASPASSTPPASTKNPTPTLPSLSPTTSSSTWPSAKHQNRILWLCIVLAFSSLVLLAWYTWPSKNNQQPQANARTSPKKVTFTSEALPTPTRPTPNTTPTPLPTTPRRPSALSKPRLPLAKNTECQPGETRTCYDGPSSSAGRGPCKVGLQTCKKGRFGPCQGQILPKRERCNGKDDNCDGNIDETFANKGKTCTYNREGGCQYRGRWRCHESGKRLRCKGNTPSPKRGYSQIQIRLSPSNQWFSLFVGKRRNRARRKYCIEINTRKKITVSARGYEMCVFTVPPSTRRLRLSLKRKSELEEIPTYCRKSF